MNLSLDENTKKGMDVLQKDTQNIRMKSVISGKIVHRIKDTRWIKLDFSGCVRIRLFELLDYCSDGLGG